MTHPGDAMRACDRHPWWYPLCDDCKQANAVPLRVTDFQPYQLTGLQKTYLDQVRARITADDLPAVEVDEDYMVTRFRGDVT